MRLGTIIGAIVVVLLIIFGIYFIDIDQTQEAEMPNVEVNVEGGQAPEFDAEVGDIETGTEEVTIEVPTVSIESPEEDSTDGDGDDTTDPDPETDTST